MISTSIYSVFSKIHENFYCLNMKISDESINGGITQFKNLISFMGLDKTIFVIIERVL